MWSKELATPGQVSLDGSNIIVTSFEDSQVSIEGYGAVEESQKPSESPTLVEAAKGPDKDAIKDFDIGNHFALISFYDVNSGCNYVENGGKPILFKMPDMKNGCWSTMVEGESQSRYEPNVLAPAGAPLLSFRDSEKKYVDINADGYDDLIVFAPGLDGGECFIYIFDPTDPEHPYVATIGNGQDPAFYHQYMGHGLFEAGATAVDSNERCVTSRFRIEDDVNGVPRVVGYETTEDVANNTDSGCL